MTPLSALLYVPFWIKFVVIPEPLRFLWWLVWCRVKAIAHAAHRRLVLQGGLLPHQELSSTRIWSTSQHLSATAIEWPHEGPVAWKLTEHAQPSGQPVYCVGPKLDVELANRSGLSNVHFSRALVLKRYHHRVTAFDTLLYRWQLLRVRVGPIRQHSSMGSAGALLFYRRAHWCEGAWTHVDVYGAVVLQKAPDNIVSQGRTQEVAYAP